MPSAFRIVLGECSCRKGRPRGSLQDVCKTLLARIDHLQSLSPAQLGALPELESEELTIGGRRTSFTTHRASLSDGETLIVVQAFVRTLAWPTFFSIGRIGHQVAEGIVVRRDGRVEEAPNDLLWDYR